MGAAKSMLQYVLEHKTVGDYNEYDLNDDGNVSYWEQAIHKVGVHEIAYAGCMQGAACT